MFSTEDLKTAIGATVIARRNAAARLREAGNPRDPFRALPGMEQQFFEAAQSVRSYDLVLNLLEREVKREARKRAGRTAQSAAVFLITAGLIILATLGFAAALLLMRCPILVKSSVTVSQNISVTVTTDTADTDEAVENRVKAILTELLAVRRSRKLNELTLSDINHAIRSGYSGATNAAVSEPEADVKLGKDKVITLGGVSVTVERE